MSIHQHATIGDTLYFWFGSNNTSGSGATGTAALADVRLAGDTASAAPILSPTPTLLTHANYPLGCYEISVAATTGNGFATGSTYGVFSTLTVDAQNPTGFMGSFNLTPIVANIKEISDDVVAADNLELDYDGTGLVRANSTLGTVTTLTGHTAQTGDNYARLGGPAGASVSADIADIPTVAEFNARTLVAASYFDPAADTVATVTDVTNLHASAATSANQTTILDRIGAFTTGGVNNILGFFQALMRSDATTPSDVGGSYDDATDSLQAIGDKTALEATVGALNDLSAAQVNAEVDTALTDVNLDHLVGISTGIPAIPTGTYIDQMMNDGSASFDRTTDSLQAIRDRGDAAWITGGGGGITDILNVVPLIPESIDLANTATWRLGLQLTNAIDDLPSTAEITPGTIDIDRKAIGGTSWASIVSGAACSEAAGLIYYDEVFDSGTGYAEADSIRITFYSQKITVAANDYEISDATGRIFYTEIRQTERGTDSAALASVATEARLAELDAANLPTDIADIPTVAEFNARTLVAASYFDPAADTVATVTDVTNLHASAATSANQTTILDRIGAFTTGGVNNILGFFQALMRSDATTPSDVGGTYDDATDSLQALGDKTALEATVGALNDLSAAQVNAEVDTALTDINLDHLVGTSVGIPAMPTGTYLDQIANDGSASFDRTTDSLQAIRDRGDSAWITGGGGGITDILNVVPLIPENIDLANTATWRLGLQLTNALDDLPSTAEITPGTIDIDRKAIGGTSWASVVSGAACSEAAGLIYYDEVFDSGTGYAEADSIRITFYSQKITVAANDYEISDATGRIFYTEIRQTMRGTDSAALASVATEARLAELDAANLPTDIADIPTVAEFNARTLVAASYFDPAADTVATVTDVTNLHASAATSANQTTILDRIGAFTTGGVNNILGFFQALMRSDATTPSDVGGTYDDATDSLQALGDKTALEATVGALNDLSAAQVNAEVDTALDTAIPGSPAADSINERLRSLDLLLESGGGGDAAAILGDTNELQGDWVDGGRLDLILDARGSQTTADAIETDTQDIQARLPAALVSGRMSSDAVAISGSTDAADKLEASAETIVTGAAVTGTLSITQMTTNLTEITDDHYIGRIIIWTSGVLQDQASDITDYDGGTKMLTYTATTEAPSNGDTFNIV